MIVLFARLVQLVVAGRVTDGKFFLRVIFMIGVGRTVFVGMRTRFVTMVVAGGAGTGR